MALMKLASAIAHLLQICVNMNMYMYIVCHSACAPSQVLVVVIDNIIDWPHSTRVWCNMRGTCSLHREVSFLGRAEPTVHESKSVVTRVPIVPLKIDPVVEVDVVHSLVK